MPNTALLTPCIAMVCITMAVWLRMLYERDCERRQYGLCMDDFATTAQVGKAFKRVQSAENFRNLFEIPVLFYALCPTLMALQVITPGYVFAAWIFVILRALHSLIHCSYNKVSHRFTAYLLSTLLLFGMWGALLFRLPAQPGA